MLIWNFSDVCSLTRGLPFCLCWRGSSLLPSHCSAFYQSACTSPHRSHFPLFPPYPAAGKPNQGLAWWNSSFSTMFLPSSLTQRRLCHIGVLLKRPFARAGNESVWWSRRKWLTQMTDLLLRLCIQAKSVIFPSPVPIQEGWQASRWLSTPFSHAHAPDSPQSLPAFENQILTTSLRTATSWHEGHIEVLGVTRGAVAGSQLWMVSVDWSEECAVIRTFKC